jgi:Metallopeptidase toxin 5
MPLQIAPHPKSLSLGRETLICSLLPMGEGLGMRGLVCRLIFENWYYTGKRVKARNKAIRAVIKDNLPDLNLRYIPEFSPNATTGMARTYEPGRGTQLGHKSFKDRNTLIDVIVHEDLHHRWRDQGIQGDHHYRRGAPYPDSLRRKDMKFYATIARYMRMRGFKYSERHADQWAKYVKANKSDRAQMVHNYNADLPQSPE